MSIRLDKSWQPLADARARLRGNLGVFQLANAAGEVIYIGFAGGRSRYGLKGELGEIAARVAEATQARWEVTSAYQTRFRELLAVHLADNGELPKYNIELNHRPANLGRLSPA